MKKKWRSTTAWRGDCICGENKQSEYGKGGISQ